MGIYLLRTNLRNWRWDISWEDKKVQKNNHILIRDNVIPNKKIKWLFRIIK